MKHSPQPHLHRRAKALNFASFLLTFTALLATSYGVPQQHIVKVEKVENGTLVYVQYDLNETQTIDLSDLELSDKLTNKNADLPSPLTSTWSSVPNFKLILLQYGLAKLRNPETALESYREAQSKAQKEGTGMWAKPPAPTPSPQTSNSSQQTPNQVPAATPEPVNEGPSIWESGWQTFVSILKFLWAWIVFLSPFSIGAFALSALYYFFWVRRRIRLLIIGNISAGKTAVFLRLVDPKIDRQTILDLGATKALTKVRMRQYIRYARYEIYPRLTDVPGSAFSTVWDELTKHRFLRRQHALLLVLAPTVIKAASNGKGAVDTKYLDTQLGYVQAFIEGALGARKTTKPKVLILFLNKFDLFSSDPPNDSAATVKKQQFLELFKEHIKSVELAAKRAKIQHKIVVGSALNNWDCDDLINVIGRALYGS